MPASIQNASVPVVGGFPIVLPLSLATQFTAVRAYDCRVNEYHDGTTERGALVTAPRRSWKITKRLSPAVLATLKTFWLAHAADAFYFYEPSETSPPYSYDATGASAAGRYTVVFQGDWSEQCSIPRIDLSLGLVEVA